MQKMLIALVVLLALPMAAAEFDFTGEYHARAGVGDIPTTTNVEADGMLHVVEYMRFTHDGNSTTFTVPLGFAETGCTCAGRSMTGDQVTIPNTVEAGDYVFWLRFESPEATTMNVDLQWNAGQTGTVVVYAPLGMEVTSEFSATVLTCAESPCTLYSFNQADGFWATMHPTVATVAPTVVDDTFGILELVLGLVAGALIWFFLVKQGIVQARGRKQVVQAAAHQEAAAAESKSMLEARKRVLMAGLKDLEKAKMAKEMDDDVYDALKTELKREAVVTMRAIESAE